MLHLAYPKAYNNHSLDSIGILTYFPFPLLPSEHRLGPANPGLICIAQEPLLFRHLSCLDKSDPTNTRILILTRSIKPYGKTSAQVRCLLTPLSIWKGLWYRQLT